MRTGVCSAASRALPAGATLKQAPSEHVHCLLRSAARRGYAASRRSSCVQALLQPLERADATMRYARRAWLWRVMQVRAWTALRLVRAARWVAVAADKCHGAVALAAPLPLPRRVRSAASHSHTCSDRTGTLFSQVGHRRRRGAVACSGASVRLIGACAPRAWGARPPARRRHPPWQRQLGRGCRQRRVGASADTFLPDTQGCGLLEATPQNAVDTAPRVQLQRGEVHERRPHLCCARPPAGHALVALSTAGAARLSWRIEAQICAPGELDTCTLSSWTRLS